MKIIFDTLIFGKQKRGGASTYWIEIMKRFLLSNHEIILLKHHNYIHDDFQKMNFDNMQVRFEKKNNINLLKNQLNVKVPNIDGKFLFHSNFLRIAKNKHAINVVTIHDFTHQKYFSGFKKLLNTIQKKHAIKKADGIICISESTKRDLVKFYPKVDLSKVAIIYNGVSNNFTVTKELSDDSTINELLLKKYILYVGDTPQYKNFQFLIDLLKVETDIHLIHVSGTTLNINDYTYDFDVISRYHKLYNVSHKNLNILYNRAFAFIYPSLYEGFGLPVIEAMRAGCPVIAFNNSSLPEVVMEGGIIVENNDLNGCIDKLNQLKDEGYRNTLIEKGFIQSQKFNWDTTFELMKEFYENLYNNKK